MMLTHYLVALKKKKKWNCKNIKWLQIETKDRYEDFYAK